MKKLSILLILMLILSSCTLSGGGDGGEAQSSSSAASSAPLYENVVTNGDWYAYSKVTGEQLNISFHPNGEYVYYCECGEPVGDSDLFDTHYVDLENGVIELSGPDGMRDRLEVLYTDKHYLCLMIDGTATVFRNARDEVPLDYHPSVEDYFTEDDYVRLTFLSYRDGIVAAAPYNYDKDAHGSFADCISSLRLADGVFVSALTVTVDHTAGCIPQINYTTLTSDDYGYIGDHYTCAYAVFDTRGELCEVIFYGSNEIWGSTECGCE